MLNVGLVLSGGLSKGAYQIGFINALLETIPISQIKAVAGSSIGALNGYGLLTNKLGRVEEYWRNFDCTSGLRLFKRFVFNRLLDEVLDQLVEPNDTLNRPFYVGATSIFPTLKFNYFKMESSYDSNWRKLFRAAIGFPILTGLPKRFNRRYYIDGGVVDNIPLKPLLEEALDLIIIVHFDSKYTIDIPLTNDDPVVLEVDLSISNRFIKTSFDFSNGLINEMIESGYEYGKKMLKTLLKDGVDNIDAIRQNALDIHIKEHYVRRQYTNLDTLPTFFNRRLKRFKNKANVIQPLPRADRLS